MSEVTQRLLGDPGRLSRGGLPAWAFELRQKGAARFSQVGLPTQKLEDWRYTSVQPLAELPFGLPEGPVEAPADAVAAHALAGAHLLVFVDGRRVATPGKNPALPPGIRVTGLQEALAEGGGALEALLSPAASGEDVFAALNLAYLGDGAVIRAQPGTICEPPIQLLFLSGAGHGATMSHPRVLIELSEGAQVTVVETYAGLSASTYFTNAVTDVRLGRGARLSHQRVQQEGPGAIHLGLLRALQEAGSHLASGAFALGARLGRSDLRSTFLGQGAECLMDGLYVGDQGQHLDNRTELDHAVAGCTSRQLYKGLLDGRAHGVFNGKILVRVDAQKTDAGQLNKTLLLSEDAQVDTKPHLEIYADDVKCSHGAAVGQLDEQALFYLRARGLSLQEARVLLTLAFAAEVIDRVRLPSLRARLEAAVGRKLDGREVRS